MAGEEAASDDRGGVPGRGSSWLLRRADQAAVAALVLAGLAGTLGWWAVQGGVDGNLIELERAEPKVARFEVDLNAADWPELVQLPGIGETLAKRIVQSRRKDGAFRSPSDLLRVRGIGPATLNAVKPFLRPIPEVGTIAQK
jgi:competence protein ComEA